MNNDIVVYGSKEHLERFQLNVNDNTDWNENCWMVDAFAYCDDSHEVANKMFKHIVAGNQHSAYISDYKSVTEKWIEKISTVEHGLLNDLGITIEKDVPSGFYNRLAYLNACTKSTYTDSPHDVVCYIDAKKYSGSNINLQTFVEEFQNRRAEREHIAHNGGEVYEINPINGNNIVYMNDELFITTKHCARQMTSVETFKQTMYNLSLNTSSFYVLPDTGMGAIAKLLGVDLRIL